MKRKSKNVEKDFQFYPRSTNDTVLISLRTKTFNSIQDQQERRPVGHQDGTLPFNSIQDQHWRWGRHPYLWTESFNSIQDQRYLNFLLFFPLERLSILSKINISAAPFSSSWEELSILSKINPSGRWGNMGESGLSILSKINFGLFSYVDIYLLSFNSIQDQLYTPVTVVLLRTNFQFYPRSTQCDAVLPLHIQ